MTKKKKAIIGVCVGAGVLLIGFLIYFFFIRFSIVGKWDKVKSDDNWTLFIDSIEFQSNGDAYIYTDRVDSGMIKGHYTVSGDNKEVTIYFDKTEHVGTGLFLGDTELYKNDSAFMNMGRDKFQFKIEDYSHNSLSIMPSQMSISKMNPYVFKKA